MHSPLSTNQPPHRCDTNTLSYENPLGDIFRKYGEDYIEQYTPNKKQIKLIRSMRVCRTPALGGRAIICLDCGNKHYHYFGCGNGHCSICQSKKREQWMQKMSAELMNVPYVHLITTLPSELRGIARRYPKIMYNLMFQVTKQTLNDLCMEPTNVGGKPGIISVLHTFGSDMKYHVHVHSLVSFGGVDEQGDWHFPKRKNKLCRNRHFKSTFRQLFLDKLEKLIEKGEIVVTPAQQSLIEDTRDKSWSFHATAPTMQTDTIELYLARYINRIAITNSRIQFIKAHEEVRIMYNDYNNQKPGEPAPKASKTLDQIGRAHV